MLAAIIANLQNLPQPQSQLRLPTVHVDRGGGGPSWPRYEFVDIIGAMALFPEIPGEHAVARAVRRHQWIGEALPKVKEAREKREASAFIAGASLADAAAAERHAAASTAAEERYAAANAVIEERHASQNRLKIEQIVEIIDSVRGTPPVKASDRGSRGNAVGFFVGGMIVGSLLVGIALSKRRRSQSRIF